MKNYFKKITVLICLIIIMVLPYIVLAASDAYNNLEKVGSKDKAPYQAITAGKNDLAGVVGIVIQAFLGILGVLFLIYVIYAGYGWMTAQGEEEKVTKAKDTLTRAVIGLIITIAAYAISVWVLGKLLFGTDIIAV